MRIRTDIDNGKEGDQRVKLVVADPWNTTSRRAANGDLMACLDTNGGLFPINTADGVETRELCSLPDACDTLGCSYAQLREAVERAYLPARDWDWYSDAAFADLTDL